MADRDTLSEVRAAMSRLDREVGRLAGAFEGLRDHRNEQVTALGEDADRQRNAIIEFTTTVSDLSSRVAMVEHTVHEARAEVVVLTKRAEDAETAAEKVSRQLEVIAALGQQPWRWLERAALVVAIVTSLVIATVDMIERRAPPAPQEQHRP